MKDKVLIIRTSCKKLSCIFTISYNNEICFFIPLRLTKDNNTNAILAVQREIGPDGKHYNVVKTLLLLEENIYQMARTAQKINIGWLSNFLLD